MITTSRANARQAVASGLPPNTSFRLGEIEYLPVGDNTVGATLRPIRTVQHHLGGSRVGADDLIGVVYSSSVKYGFRLRDLELRGQPLHGSAAGLHRGFPRAQAGRADV